MTTLAEHMIVVGAENRPPMLDKTMYNSWQSRMLLYIKGKKNGRMTLESIENGPLLYPTIRKRPECKDYGLWKLSDGKSNNFSSLLMEGLGHNLFSVSQFRDSDLEINVVIAPILSLSKASKSKVLVKASNTPTNPKLKTQFKKSSGPWPQHLNVQNKPNTDSCQSLLSNTVCSTQLIKDGDILFQPMFDEYLNPPPSVAFPVHAIIAPEPADSTNPPSSTTIDQDAPSPSTSQTP
ncbi:hypothetical protein Tco_0005443 [Tanacetum coccineum]